MQSFPELDRVAWFDLATAAGQGQRAMAGLLKAPEQKDLLQIADVERPGRRVEPAVQGHRPGLQQGGQFGSVGRVVDQRAGLERRDQVGLRRIRHGGSRYWLDRR